MIDEGAVLLTGATGFIGSNLAAQILIADERRVFCLVRSKHDYRLRLMKALAASARAAGIWEKVRDKIGRIIAVPCDLGQDNLALSSGSRRDLHNADVRELWHCAASMRFEERHRDEIFTTNVAGTRRLLTLAEQVGADSFHYMSTAYVAGSRRGVIPETAYDPAVPPNNLYEESKRRAEDLVVAAAKRFRVTVLRPSVVIGSSKTLDATSEFGLYGFLAGLHTFAEQIEDKVPGFLSNYPLRLLWEPGATMDLMPVDMLVQEALAIARLAGKEGPYFHLVNPFAIDLEELREALLKPISRLHRLRFDLVSDAAMLRPLDHMFHRRLSFYIPYLMNAKMFERKRDRGSPPPALRISKAAMTGYAERFLARLQGEIEHRARKRMNALHGLQSRTVQCRNGEPLTYRRQGKGPAVVLINAYGVSLEFWAPVIAALLPRYKILTWECRGCSQNGADRPYGIREHAEDLREILDHEDIHEAHLLGWCTGPKVALEFQNRYPDAVASMTFITGSFAPLPGAGEISTRYDEVLGKVAGMVCRRPEMTDVFLRALSGILIGAPPVPAAADTDLRDLMGMVASRFRGMIVGPFLSERVIANYARMIVEYQQHDIARLLDGAAVPTLLISAENDVIAHPDGSDAVARRMPDARSVRLAGASHWCLLENPDEVNEEICAFLSLVESRRRMALASKGSDT